MPIEEVLRRNLTDGQYTAATAEEREVLCLACAGSGKSRTLAYRIARLISESNLAESIVAFTFTEKAAESIKRRVAEALERSGHPVALVGAMYIGTIHSYCQHLLGEMDARYRQFEVLDDNKLKLFLLSRYWQLGLNEVRITRTTSANDPGMFRTISEVANAWKLANDELLDFDEIERYFPQLGRCLKNIRDRFMADQYIDFSLMIRQVVEALRENNQSINRALANVRHLMVDEYQDVNPSQEALIARIHDRTDTLFCVGDDDQSIYAWRGADVQNIITFQQRYPRCSMHVLNTNFRSTQTIVEVTNQFIRTELSTQRIDKDPIHNDNGNVRQFGNFWFDTRQEEARWVAQRISELLGVLYIDDTGERGLTKSDFAILMRSVTSGDPAYYREFVEALREVGIEYTIESEEGIFVRPHGRIIRASMELLRNAGVSRQQAQLFFDSDVIQHFPNADFNRFARVLSEWNTKIHTPAGGARRKVYPQELVHDLLSAFGVATTDFDSVVLRDLGIFSGIILDVEKVYVSIDSSNRFSEVLNFLHNVAETGYDSSTVELVARPDAVTISTVHKMKGLEFPVVFVVDVVNQRFPGRNSSYQGWLPTEVIQPITARGLYGTNIFSEARLFYTALTRAERFLYVTGSAIHPGLQRPKQQSRFKLRLTHQDVTNDHTSLPDNVQRVAERRRIDDNSMPTSFTEIKDYLECPMKYKFRKVYGFSPAVPELFGLGLTTHTAINKLHQISQQEVPGAEEAEDSVEEVFHLKHVFPSRNPESAPGPFENAKNKAKEIVSRYVEEYPDDFRQNRQVEVRFEIRADDALITGSFDLLLREDEQGNILDAKVIDFKSMDFPEPSDTFFWINLSLQVQLYAHAANVVLGENARTGAVHLLKAQDSKNHRIELIYQSQIRLWQLQ